MQDFKNVFESVSDFLICTFGDAKKIIIYQLIIFISFFKLKISVLLEHVFVKITQNYEISIKEEQVGKDQEMRNQKKIPTPKTEVEKKNTKLTIRYLYHENIS